MVSCLALVLRPSLPPNPPRHIIFTFCIWRNTTLDLESFQSSKTAERGRPFAMRRVCQGNGAGSGGRKSGVWAGSDAAVRSWASSTRLGKPSVEGVLGCEGL